MLKNEHWGEVIVRKLASCLDFSYWLIGEEDTYMKVVFTKSIKI